MVTQGRSESSGDGTRIAANKFLRLNNPLSADGHSYQHARDHVMVATVSRADALRMLSRSWKQPTEPEGGRGPRGGLAGGAISMTGKDPVVYAVARRLALDWVIAEG
ncbi:hypothetical protein Misp03_59470 [Microbispora sp. NBRC 16548]|nr:hypothetical protein Misp03_59470 [Microbispora sp. NBRC 16548]